MAKLELVPDDDGPEETETSSDRLAEVHARALKRFEAASNPQMEIRAHALLCRRFISVPGAMWEGAWGEQFENSIMVEIDKLSKGVDKIVGDYRSNRIVPDFRPAGGSSDQESADTLDGLHRADSYHFKAQQARDNAFEEAVAGGFGAYRLGSDYADPYDKDSDEQRVNPGLTIVDADQRVYFDPNSKLYDKSDAKWCFVLTADAKESFEEEWPDASVSWPDPKLRPAFDWFAPDVVVKAEYYEVEDRNEQLLIFRQAITGAEQRWWSSELDADEVKDLEARGWTKTVKRRQRRRVHKYVMSGAEVLEDCKLIAGDQIPVVPVYGKRWFVDNQERFRGFVSKRMDAQRIYNAKVSKLSETDALSPREKPIFLAEQMPPHLADLWAKQETERHPYALVNPVIDNDGKIVAMGPIGKIEPPTVSQVTALLLQAAAADLDSETIDGADEAKSNLSHDAMDLAATRTDAKSGIYLDNMKQSVQREGEIYLSIAREVYHENGRTVETMTEDGDDGEAVLGEAVTDKTGKHYTRNDFATGKYKVIADVTEATATRRDKTVRSSLAMAEIAMKAGDQALAQAAIITAVMNTDGEGMTDFQKFARKRGLAIQLVEPNEDEKAQMQQEQQQPDPQAMMAEAQAQNLAADAQLKGAKAQEAGASTMLKVAQAHAIGGPEQAPAVPDGLESAHKIAQIAKTAAEADHLRTTTAHLPQQLGIEAQNAETNRIKASHTSLAARLRAGVGKVFGG